MSHFASSRSRIRWAKKDIAHFEKNSLRFFQRTKGTLVKEPDSDGIYEVHKFKLDKSLPEVLTQRAISAAENLRSALDLAVVDVGRLVGLPAPNLENLAFPFCAKDKDLNSRIGGCCSGLPDEIKTLLMSYKPYEGGEVVLWALNELCRASKHRLIVPVNQAAHVVFGNFEAIGGTKPVHINEGQIEASEDEIVLARTESGLHYKYNARLFLGVAFAKVKGVEGKEVFPTLLSMRLAVSTIVDEIEQKCKEIGILR